MVLQYSGRRETVEFSFLTSTQNYLFILVSDMNQIPHFCQIILFCSYTLKINHFVCFNYIKMSMNLHYGYNETVFLLLKK